MRVVGDDDAPLADRRPLTTQLLLPSEFSWTPPFSLGAPAPAARWNSGSIGGRTTPVRRARSALATSGPMLATSSPRGTVRSRYGDGRASRLAESVPKRTTSWGAVAR